VGGNVLLGSVASGNVLGSIASVKCHWQRLDRRRFLGSLYEIVVDLSATEKAEQ
jgi:hypothetical protein